MEGAPVGRVSLRMLVGARLQEWMSYLERTQRAFDDVRAGRKVVSPGEVVFLPSELPAWARPFVWDTEDVENCLLVTRSTADTVFPRDKQLNRSRFHEAARFLGWDRVDPISLRRRVAAVARCARRRRCTPLPLGIIPGWSFILRMQTRWYGRRGGSSGRASAGHRCHRLVCFQSS